MNTRENEVTVQIRQSLSIPALKELKQAVEFHSNSPLQVGYNALHDPEEGWQLILVRTDGEQEKISLHSVNDQLENLEDKKEEQIEIIKKIAQNDKLRRLNHDIQAFVSKLKDDLEHYLDLTFSPFFKDKKHYEEAKKQSATCSLIFQGPRASKALDTLKEIISNSLDAGANELTIKAILNLDDLQISFDIQDNGPGFPPSFLSHPSVLAGNTLFRGDRNRYQSEKKDLTSLGGVGKGLNSIINNEQGAEVKLENVYPTGPRKCARIIITASAPKPEEKLDDDEFVLGTPQFNKP